MTAEAIAAIVTVIVTNIGTVIAIITKNKTRIDALDKKLAKHIEGEEKLKNDVKDLREKVIRIDERTEANRSMIGSRKDEMQKLVNRVEQDKKDLRVEFKDDIDRMFKNIINLIKALVGKE